MTEKEPFRNLRSSQGCNALALTQSLLSRSFNPVPNPYNPVSYGETHQETNFTCE